MVRRTSQLAVITDDQVEGKTRQLLRGVLDGSRSHLAEAITLGNEKLNVTVAIRV